ncbi:MAG: lysylphosphatidylglycerol synthase transmembrane domain-containing protein [Candidatus Bathyarchaeia archaeon]
MNPRIRFALMSAIGAVVFIGLLWIVDVEKVYEAIVRASPAWIMVSAVATVGVFAVRAWRWKLLLQPSQNSVRTASTFWITTLGAMVNMLVPVRLAGEFVRAFVVDRRENTGFFQGLSSIVVERLLDLLAIVTLALVSLLMLPEVPDALGVLVNFTRGIAVATVAVLAVIFFGCRRQPAVIRVLTLILRRIPILREKWRSRLVELAHSLMNGAKAISEKRRTFVLILLSSWAVWGLTFFSIYVLFEAFGYEASVPIVLFGAMLLSLSFIFPASPGYVGTDEAYWSLIFVALGFAQLNLTLAIGIMSHIIVIITTIALGSLSITWLGMSASEVFSFRQISQAKAATVK